jgi:hypothetical protein
MNVFAATIFEFHGISLEIRQISSWRKKHERKMGMKHRRLFSAYLLRNFKYITLFAKN